MKAIIDAICSWFMPKPPCAHKRYIEHRWLEENTPFVSFRCKDCGYHDTGHVHGSPDNWEGRTET